MLSSKLIEHARLAIYRGAPHGLCSTLKEKVTGTEQRRSVALILHESVGAVEVTGIGLILTGVWLMHQQTVRLSPS